MWKDPGATKCAGIRIVRCFSLTSDTHTRTLTQHAQARTRRTRAPRTKENARGCDPAGRGRVGDGGGAGLGSVLLGDQLRCVGSNTHCQRPPQAGKQHRRGDARWERAWGQPRCVCGRWHCAEIVYILHGMPPHFVAPPTHPPSPFQPSVPARRQHSNCDQREREPVPDQHVRRQLPDRLRQVQLGRAGRAVLLVQRRGGACIGLDRRRGGEGRGL